MGVSGLNELAIQLIESSTHNHGNVLDWFISHLSCDTFVSLIEVIDHLLSDHCVISVHTNFSKPHNTPKISLCRNLRDRV